MWRPAEGRFEALEPFIAWTALHFGDKQDEHIRVHDETAHSHILNEIDTWSQALDSPPVLCLTGSIGAGKTTLTERVAKLTRQRAHLAGEFFFSRDDPMRNGLKAFVPTLTYHLGFILPSAAKVIRSTLSTNPSVLHASPDVQWDSLIIKPLEALAGQSISFRPFFIIDGVDECPSREDQEWVIKKMIHLCTQFPVALLLSSRPEYHIKREITDLQKQHPSCFRPLIKLGDDKVIREQMRELLRPVMLGLDGDGTENDPLWVSSTPLDNFFEGLISGACGQFLVIEAIQDYARRDEILYSPRRRERFNRLLDDEKEQAKAFSLLDQRYDALMASSQSHLPAGLRTQLNKILWYLLYIQSDGIETISIFWDISATEMRLILQQYYSVLRVPTSNDEPISFDTLSYRRFLSSEHRGGKHAQHHISKSSLIIDAFERSIYLAQHPGLYKTTNVPAYLFSLWLKLIHQIDFSTTKSAQQSKQRVIRALKSFEFLTWVSRWHWDHKDEELVNAYVDFRHWLEKVSKDTLKKFDKDALAPQKNSTAPGNPPGTWRRLFKVLLPK
ncbi:hypothetical protein AX16_004308 [Volvariella volvacea WC 439]|nr:hypothetical protein AX16_004308 [Volvariella volvacea WC 439]